MIGAAKFDSEEAASVLSRLKLPQGSGSRSAHHKAAVALGGKPGTRHAPKRTLLCPVGSSQGIFEERWRVQGALKLSHGIHDAQTARTGTDEPLAERSRQGGVDDELRRSSDSIGRAPSKERAPSASEAPAGKGKIPLKMARGRPSPRGRSATAGLVDPSTRGGGGLEGDETPHSSSGEVARARPRPAAASVWLFKATGHDASQRHVRLAPTPCAQLLSPSSSVPPTPNPLFITPPRCTI